MARDCVKNTSNYLVLGVNKLGPLVANAQVISAHVRVWVDSITSGAATNDGFFTIVNGANLAGPTFRIDSTGTPVLKVGGRSNGTDAFQSRNATSEFTFGEWHSVGGVWNIAGDTITPYWNGTAENSGAVTFGSAAYSNNTTGRTVGDGIGCAFTAPTTTANQLDGRICQLAIWTGDIGSTAFSDLAGGLDAADVATGTLVYYNKMDGTNLTAHTGGGDITVTGTVDSIDDPTFGEEPAVIVPRGMGSARHVRRRIARR